MGADTSLRLKLFPLVLLVIWVVGCGSRVEAPPLTDENAETFARDMVPSLFPGHTLLVGGKTLWGFSSVTSEPDHSPPLWHVKGTIRIWRDNPNDYSDYLDHPFVIDVVGKDVPITLKTRQVDRLAVSQVLLDEKLVGSTK